MTKKGMDPPVKLEDDLSCFVMARLDRAIQAGRGKPEPRPLHPWIVRLNRTMTDRWNLDHPVEPDDNLVT